VNTMDERILRRRLHEELGAVEPPPAPVDAVTRRGRSIRARRRSTVVAASATLAAALAIAMSLPGASRPQPVAPTRHKVTLNVPDPRAPGGVFASGTANGRPWRLAVQNIAGPRPSCLPAVMLNGHDGNPIFGRPRAHSPVPNAAFLPDVPGEPGIGFFFAQVGPVVTTLSALLKDGTRLAAHPVTVPRCGQQLRLVGFAYPASGLKAISVYLDDRYVRLSDQPVFVYRPPSAIFSPRSYLPGVTPAGIWVGITGTHGVAASGVIASGKADSRSWRLSMTLGPAGQCYTGSATGGGPPDQAEECVPIEPFPDGVDLTSVPFPAAPQLAGYAGLVSPRTAYLMASLSDGTIRRLVPVDIGGRKYFGLAIGHGTTLVGLTVHDAAGHPFGIATSVSAVK
jgi:hypothetical protein